MKHNAPAALLAIPLATAFAGNAAAAFSDPDPVTYNFTVNPTIQLTEAFLFVASSSPIVDIVNLGPFAAGTNQNFTHIDDTFSSDENRLVFLAVYEEDNVNDPNFGIPGISVSLIDFDAINATSPTFEELFSEIFFGQPEGAEDTVISDLRGTPDEFGDAAAFARGFAFGGTPGFFIDLPAIGFDNTSEITLGNFSTLSDGGTLEVTRVSVIPEPASLALLGFGGLMLAGRRRG